MKELFKELEEFGKTHDYMFNISRKTGEFLNKLVKEYKPKRILELGTSNGYSTLWLAKDTDAEVITIEFDEEKIELAKENFKKSKLKNIKLIFGNALDEIPKLKGKFDFVFIDAMKKEYLEYLKLLLPKLEKGTVIAAHNVVSMRDSLEDYLDFVKKNFRTITYEELDLEVSVI